MIVVIILKMDEFLHQDPITNFTTSKCSNDNYQLMNSLLFLNNFVAFSLTSQRAVLHKLDAKKEFNKLSNDVIVWLNGKIYSE